MSQDMSLFGDQLCSTTPTNVELPIIGAMYANSIEWIWDEVYYSSHAVSLTQLEWEKEYRRDNDIPDDDDLPEEAYEYLEFDEETYLLGDWELGEDGLYDVVPNCNGQGYAAILGYLGGAPIVHVQWSETIAHVRALCSPCCPGQADLDSGAGDILAYTLPDLEG